MNVSLLGNMYDSDYFEDPFEFKPERWLKENPIKNPYMYLPFSSGVRNCIGQHLALIETRIILAELISRHRFKLIDGYDLKMR